MQACGLVSLLKYAYMYLYSYRLVTCTCTCTLSKYFIFQVKVIVKDRRQCENKGQVRQTCSLAKFGLSTCVCTCTLTRAFSMCRCSQFTLQRFDVVQERRNAKIRRRQNKSQQRQDNTALGSLQRDGRRQVSDDVTPGSYCTRTCTYGTTYVYMYG